MAGLIVFVIPAIVIFVIWYVAVPACVIERRDAIESLSRSQELTRGHRWAIFGLLLIVAIASGIGSYLLESVAMLVLGSTIAAIVSALWSVLTSAYGAVALTVVYHDLRVEKEGVDAEQIAEMFA
jgi:hypothetical protein